MNRIWHCTFCINSLAHYLGDQPYSEDVTARGNYLLAILTGGEASHNFHHAFPQDYRNGPNHLDWDPTKLFIWFFHKCTNQVPNLKRTEPSDILKAKSHVLHCQAERVNTTARASGSSDLPKWERAEVYAQVQRLTDDKLSTGSLTRPLVLVIDNYAVDASTYAKSHPGGIALLRHHAVTSPQWTDSSEAFNGGLNNHGTAAKQKMAGLRIARIDSN